MCACRLINYNKRTTLVGNADKRGGVQCGDRGIWEISRLFAAKLKLP